MSSIYTICQFVEFAIRTTKVLPGIAAQLVHLQGSNQFDMRLNEFLAGLLDIIN